MPNPPYRNRLRQPPSSLTGDVYFYLREVANAVNAMPQLSYFSGATPNGVEAGLSGDLRVNLASASTDSRLWMMGGANLGSYATNGWVVLRTLA